jgi:hypothetical protein
VQYRVADAVVLLHARPGRMDEHREAKEVGVTMGAGRITTAHGTERKETYTPFVVIRPDVHAPSADVLKLEERERRLGRGYLYRYVLVLEGARRMGPDAGQKIRAGGN